MKKGHYKKYIDRWQFGIKFIKKNGRRTRTVTNRILDKEKEIK